MAEDIKITLTSREAECLRAASKLLENAIENEIVDGFGGMALDNRISGRQLLVEVAHDKYLECVSTPKSDEDARKTR